MHLELQKKDGSVETLDFTLDFFARALVFLCQGNNIPIPRAGTKKSYKKITTFCYTSRYLDDCDLDASFANSLT